jgi:gluconate kinase
MHSELQTEVTSFTLHLLYSRLPKFNIRMLQRKQHYLTKGIVQSPLKAKSSVAN